MSKKKEQIPPTTNYAFHWLVRGNKSTHGGEPAWKDGEIRVTPREQVSMCDKGYHSSRSLREARAHLNVGSVATLVLVSDPVKEDCRTYKYGNHKAVSQARKLVFHTRIPVRSLLRRYNTNNDTWNTINLMFLEKLEKKLGIESGAYQAAARLIWDDVQRNPVVE